MFGLLSAILLSSSCLVTPIPPGGPSDLHAVSVALTEVDIHDDNREELYEKLFSCRMAFDLTFEEGGRRAGEEVAVYEVNDDRIVREHFSYSV